MASAVIGALRVNLSLDTAQFSEGLKGMQASMQRVGKQMQGWGTKMSTYITAPLTLAGGAVAAAAAGLAKDIDELRKAAQISNVGFEEFQKLAFAARSVGIEGDKLSDIFKDVNDRIGDFNATGGGPMADFFENIAPKVGITAEAFKNLSGPQALQLYYDSLVKAGASQQDMTFYLEAMASDATALIPLLAQGGEGFRKLGEGAAVVTEEQAGGLKAYNDAMRAFGEAVKALTIALATSGIIDFVTGLVQKGTELVQMLAQTNPQILQWGVVIGGIAAAIGPVVVALGLMLTAVSAISAPVLAAVAAIAATTAGMVALYQALQIAIPYLQQLAGEIWAQIKAGVESTTQAFIAFKDRVVQIATDIVNAFMALPARMMEIGGQIIDGLWNGIKAKWESVKAGVTGIADSITTSIKSTLGIHSPSRVMHQVGEFIMQGLNNGMQSVDVKSGVVGVANEIEGAFQDIGSSIGAAIAGTKSWKDVLKDVLGMLTQSAFSGLGGGAGGGGFGGLLSGLFGSIFGFARGGTILPGGAGGVDSQLVMFRKSPNERVDVTKPGQTLNSGRGGVADVRVFVDDNGNWQAKVEQISDSRVANAAPSIVGQANRNVVPTMSKWQNDKAGSEWR
ncbi:phage tail protein [Pseudorhizobium sp. NPDC055634]